MPYTFNGCGTSFYGQRDRGPDGSYITTKWITVFWVPLVPIRSYRVLPVGKGTGAVVYSSQPYQTVRVSFCWTQVRNVFLISGPIILLVIYFSWPNIQKWFKEDMRPTTSQSTLQIEPLQAQPVEADLPLNSKDAAVACGAVLKLDKAGFEKLDLVRRLSSIVDDSGFTEQEFKELSPSKDVQDEAFSAYGFAYITWDKSKEASRADFDRMVVDSTRSVDLTKLSSDEKVRFDAYMVKFKRMMLRAFDLGRHDAKLSPCPF